MPFGAASIRRPLVIRCGCSVSTGEWFVVCVVRDASDGSTGPQTRKAPLDVGQVVLRVVEGVLE
jgi:hypothetical protein